MSNLIPITIITGFLGAGKTTVLNALLRDPEFADTAVLINEFGEVQVDHDLVTDFSDELIMTTTGCICCTASSDIKQSLYHLWSKAQAGEIGPFKRVLVETTGLMDPAPVVNALLSPSSSALNDRVVGQQFALSRVVTLYDAISGARTLDDHPEALKQLALADAVLLTKTDMASIPDTNHDTASANERILAVNPGAKILDRHTDWAELRETLLSSGTYDLRSKGEDAIAWLKAEQILAETENHHTHEHGHADNQDHLDRTRHGDDIRSHVILLKEPVRPVVFFMALEALRRNAGTDLLRVKGLVALSDDPGKPVVVHGVKHVTHPVDRLERWPSDDRRTKIVLIGRNLNIDALREVLSSLGTEASNNAEINATAARISTRFQGADHQSCRNVPIARTS